MARRTKPSRGSTLIEFTLVGIPLVFILISIFEIARGMWVYTTLAYAIREGARYAIVHGGQNCSAAPNQCQISVQQVAQRIQYTGAGLLPDQLTVTLTTDPNDSTSTFGPATLATLLTNTSYYPVGAGSGAGIGNVVITGTYPFVSAISLFWPGSGPVKFGVFTLGASSRERIQF